MTFSLTDPITDPLFIDPYRDWHVLSGSGAIGNGANLNATPAADYDFDGNPRPPSPTAWDVGAYAYKALP